jgi:hypothetical protein
MARRIATHQVLLRLPEALDGVAAESEVETERAVPTEVGPRHTAFTPIQRWHDLYHS